MNIEIETDPVYDFIQAPWKATGQTPLDWFHSNFERFVYSRDQITASAVPYDFGDGPNAGGIYFLLNDGHILYTGMASAIYKRLIQHVDSGKPYTHYWCFGGIPEMFVNDVESFYIHYLRPPLNVHQGRMDEFLRKRVKAVLSRPISPPPGRAKSSR